MSGLNSMFLPTIFENMSSGSGPSDSTQYLKGNAWRSIKANVGGTFHIDGLNGGTNIEIILQDGERIDGYFTRIYATNFGAAVELVLMK